MAQAISQHAIETDDLSRFPPGRGPEHVVRGISLTVPRGARVGLLGGNGAGKSTLLKMLIGLAPIGQGRASLLGRPVPTPASRTGVGYLGEHATPFEYLTGREHLTLFAQVEGLRGKTLADTVTGALDRAGLLPYGDVLVRRYSKGMIQKLEIARVLMQPRELLLLDEPVTALDALAELALEDRLTELAKTGVTLVMTSHSLRILEDLCDHFIVLGRGRLVRSGPRQDVLGTRGWCIELVAGSRLPDPLPPGGLPLPERNGVIFSTREEAEVSLGSLLKTHQVVSYGPVSRGVSDVLREVAKA